MLAVSSKLSPFFIEEFVTDILITSAPSLLDANSNETLLRCIAALKDYFNIDNWSINQPITLSQIYVLLDGIQGVQTVPRPDAQGVGGLQITNKYNGNYSPNKYSINTATKMGVIFPPKDSSIFEVISFSS